MSLGDFFPASVREAHIEQRLTPGAVLYLPVTFPRDGKTKEKYLVLVASVAPKLLMFVINTEVNQLVARTPALSRCNVVIPQSEHAFLDYDSNVACHEILALDASVVAGQLNASTGRYKGYISDELKQQILGVIATQPKTISKVHRDAIVAAFT
ncbi:MAG TPA: hypothetical protein VFG03_08335 [Telluria sp.]|nr:hypothetical protein [Telluria sp.]